MKKIALLLCVVLMLSTLMVGCKKSEEPSPESGAPSGETSGPESMPETAAEIYAHNMEIDESAIDLVQFNTPEAGSPIATIKTSLGDIKMVLFPKEAPKAVENFQALVEKGYYNGLKVYSAVPSVHVATGDPDNNGSGGESASGEPFHDEYSLNLWHFNGAVAMDNGGTPGQNGSRFFIVQNSRITDELGDKMFDGGFPEKVIQKYLEVGGVPNYDARDTVFGQVIEGMDVVEKIAAVPTDADHKPTEDVVITSVELGTL